MSVTVPPAETVHSADVGTVAAFLSYVHQHAISAGIPGRIVLTHTDDGRHRSLSYPLARRYDAALTAANMSDAGRNVYVRVHLIGRDLNHAGERGRSSDTTWVTHFAGDVDIAGAGHAERNLPATVAEALGVIDASLAPTAIIASGGGLYPIWRLAEPLHLRNDDDRQLVKQIGKRIDQALAAHSFHVDAVCGDLARIIRPAGVVNHKPGRPSRLVTIERGYLHHDAAADYTLDQLDRMLPKAAAIPLPAPSAKRHQVTGIAGPWDIIKDLYTVDDILAADPVDRWERVAHVYDAGAGGPVPAWRRVGSTAAYSMKEWTPGVVTIWSASTCSRLQIDAGGSLDLWQLACRLAGRDPVETARWRS